MSKESINNVECQKPKLFRVSTISMSLNLLLKGQLEFLNQDFEVTAISGAGKDLEIVKNREGVKVFAIEMQRQISLFKDLKSLFLLYQYFKKEKPDIVHSITPKAGLLTMLAGKMVGVPVRMHTFTGLIFPNKEGIMKRVLIGMDQLLCWAATHVYPEGNGVKNDLLKYKITTKPLRVIANGNVNGIDVEEYNPELFSEVDENILRQKLKISPEDFVFVFVGRLVIDKGLKELLGAFGKVSNKFPNAKLVLVGPREDEKSKTENDIFSEIENNQNIIAVGYQEEVRPYFAMANVFVLPSYREGFPNAVLQAGAMNLPSIVTDISGANEIIQQNENGIIIPPKNQEELEKAMVKLLTSPDFLLSLKNNTRERIIQLFDKNLVWQELRREYKRLLQL
ncbi:glycosyltransferase family 4 protein [Cloacibacterium sp.]|uniref:glycosyltransferase family 4 protein n=1 Tax=Cloacibacterium sp. TaxID=1913682 RepID=UPI0039E46A91